MSTQRNSEAEVKSWGFPHVFTWTDGPYVVSDFLGKLGFDEIDVDIDGKAHYPPHSHRSLTTHLILRGSLTITYPKDEQPEKITYGVGDRIDVDAGRVHEVWIGDEGCTYVIGE